MSKEMTAVEFVKAKSRLCLNSKMCNGCPIWSDKRKGNLTCVDFCFSYPEKVVELVEKWARKHPAKTRQSEFYKIYPDVVKCEGVIDICPKMLGGVSEEKCREYNYCDSCSGCKREYWLHEVKE